MRKKECLQLCTNARASADMGTASRAALYGSGSGRRLKVGIRGRSEGVHRQSSVGLLIVQVAMPPGIAPCHSTIATGSRMQRMYSSTSSPSRMSEDQGAYNDALPHSVETQPASCPSAISTRSIPLE